MADAPAKRVPFSLGLDDERAVQRIWAGSTCVQAGEWVSRIPAEVEYKPRFRPRQRIGKKIFAKIWLAIPHDRISVRETRPMARVAPRIPHVHATRLLPIRSINPRVGGNSYRLGEVSGRGFRADGCGGR
jgi:hypothetical protein